MVIDWDREPWRGSRGDPEGADGAMQKAVRSLTPGSGSMARPGLEEESAEPPAVPPALKGLMKL